MWFYYYIFLLYGNISIYFFVCVSQQMCNNFFLQSRERCDEFLGASLPSHLKGQQKDRMFKGEDGPMWAMSQIGFNDMGVLNSSWSEENSSNCFQEVQNGIGYVDPPEECK